MALTKDDLQAIGNLVSSLIERQMPPIVQREVKSALVEQNKFISRNFEDMKALMEQTYVKREEFEQLREDFQNELDDLRKEVQRLQQEVSTTWGSFGIRVKTGKIKEARKTYRMIKVPAWTPYQAQNHQSV